VDTIQHSMTQYTIYPLVPVVLPLQTLFVASLKLTASSRPTASPSGSAKCLRLGHWLTLCTLNMHLLTYLLHAPQCIQCSWVYVAFAFHVQVVLTAHACNRAFYSRQIASRHITCRIHMHLTWSICSSSKLICSQDAALALHTQVVITAPWTSGSASRCFAQKMSFSTTLWTLLPLFGRITHNKCLLSHCCQSVFSMHLSQSSSPFVVLNLSGVKRPR